MEDLLSSYFWAFALVIGVVNFFIVRQRAVREMAKKPELREGYEKLLRGYAVATNLPWVVMGLGMLLGGVPSIWSFFRPRDGNPFVLAWYVTVIAVNTIVSLWVLLQGGADFLVAHPGIVRGQSSAAIKLQFGLGLVGMAVFVGMLWFSNLPIG